MPPKYYLVVNYSLSSIRTVVFGLWSASVCITQITFEYIIYGRPLMEERRYEGDEDEENSG